MFDNGFWMGMATIIAVFLGPVLAVVTSRYLDRVRADKARKMDIFRTLMRTRGLTLNFDHVAALNLVQVEFTRDTEVLLAWMKYLANLKEPWPSQPDLQIEAGKRRETLLTKLIAKIAKSLHIETGKLDIPEGGYVPTGWIDDENQQRHVRSGVLDLLYKLDVLYKKRAEGVPIRLSDDDRELLQKLLESRDSDDQIDPDNIPF